VPNDFDQFDLFVSYSRKDDKSGWITCFVEKLQEEHRRYSGGREVRVFFDQTEYQTRSARRPSTSIVDGPLGSRPTEK
jgi:hypothetical protein